MRSRRVAPNGWAIDEGDMISTPGIVAGAVWLPEGIMVHCGDAEGEGTGLACQIIERERLAVTGMYRPIECLMVRVEDRLDWLIGRAPRSISARMVHALKGGGKRLRPALTLLAGSFHDAEGEALVCAATAIELLHTATLVHDDTIDNALLRRERLTVNHLWGSHDAVFLGDYLCAASAYMAAETGNAEAMAGFSKTLSALCYGAVGEHAMTSRYCMDEYFQTIGGKTAALFSTAMESGALLSGAPRNVVCGLKGYGYNLGMAFQIVDDVHDVASDLARGILNLPALLVLEGPGGTEISHVLEWDNEKGRRLISAMVQSPGVLDRCRQMARTFRDKAHSALEPLPRNAARDSLVRLAEYLTEREG